MGISGGNHVRWEYVIASMLYTIVEQELFYCTCCAINPRHACAARVTVVVPCVCLSVTTYSLTTHGFSPNKVYQKIQRDAGTILKRRFL